LDNRRGLPNGTLLDGSYRIERVIGSGGFGITYEAEDVKLGTRVAIKEYYPGEFGHRDAGLSVRATSEKQKATFEWGRTSFLQEARTLARFRHPSVVQVTRVFEAHSTAYMVMIFEEEQDFAVWLKRLGRLPTQQELDRIVGPLLDALEMMHAADFLHRDIAPDNIIVRADGTPVLLDFGAARHAVAEKSQTLTGIVKAGYSPHEQYATDGRLQGPWTDLYALGATLYRAVTGKPPEEAMLRMTDDQLAPAAETAKGMYRSSFLTAIDACLKVRPSERPQLVAQLRPMLFATQPSTERFAETRKIGEAKPAATRSGRRSTKRWWAAAAALALVGGVYGGLQYTRWDAEERGKVEAEAKRKVDRNLQRQADAAAAKKKTAEEQALARDRAEAEAKRREVEMVEAERKAAEERARQQAEAKRRADAAAARKKAEEEALARVQAEAEAQRKEDERRRIVGAMQAPIDNLFAAWRRLDAEAYIAQWAANAVKIDLRAGTTKSINQLAGERRRFFAQLSRVDAEHRSQFRGMSNGTGLFDVSYKLTLHYRNGREFSESACESYEVRMHGDVWLIARNEDYKPCF
jgi:hypothetical protein